MKIKTKRSTMILVGSLLSVLGISVLCLGVYKMLDIIKKNKTFIQIY